MCCFKGSPIFWPRGLGWGCELRTVLHCAAVFSCSFKTDSPLIKIPREAGIPTHPHQCKCVGKPPKISPGGGSGLPPRAPPALCPPITNLERGAGGDADGEGQLSELAARPHEGHLGIPSRGRRASSLPQSPGGRKERGEERAGGEKEHKRA